MAEFTCPVVTVEVVSHPDADRLEVARIGGYECVVGKGQYVTGDRAVYLPEASILPDSLVEELGLVGRLAGSAANRVKAVRLRGVLSQGLLVALDSPHLAHVGALDVGDDARERLGVEKYVPPIPVHMQGVVAPGPGASFDVEPWQEHLGVFTEGEPVQVTEKLHGTFCQVGFDLDEGPFAASKSMAGKTSFVLDAPENEANLYVRAWRVLSDRLEAAAREYGRSVTLCGEIAGPRVQDLHYNLTEPTLFVFDALAGPPSERNWISPREVLDLAAEVGAAHVPVLEAECSFNHDAVMRLAAQPSALGGGLREGVVVRPTEVRHERDLGRAMLKFVNPNYLTRHGGTDHN